MPSQLFSPLQLGPIELSNRIAVSPMCQYSADDGSASDWHIQHLASLGLSGAGLVIVEATGVEARGRISHGCLGLYSDANEAALAHVMAIARRFARAGSFRHPACPCRPQGLDPYSLGAAYRPAARR